jgi:ADP-heptose:LPS heptosyltransferase
MIIISPYSKALHNGNTNPKNYPYWEELIAWIQINIGFDIVQVGIEGEKQLVEDFRKNLSIEQLKDLIQECHIWIGCDSFFQHLAWTMRKKGIVLWSVSDPNIFGHPENINLLKDRSYLVENQFLWWEFVPHNLDAFVKPQEVVKYIQTR